MGRHGNYVIRKLNLTGSQLEVLVDALVQYEEREMDYGSPALGNSAFAVRKKISTALHVTRKQILDQEADQ